MFGIALRETYAFEDIRYLFFAEGREQETQAYIERMAIRKDQQPSLGRRSSARSWSRSPRLWEARPTTIRASGSSERPVLIVSGDRDPFFPLKNTWLLYEKLSDTQVHRVSARRFTRLADSTPPRSRWRSSAPSTR